MAIPYLFPFLFFLLLSTPISSSPLQASISSRFIRAACATTRYPVLCFRSLSPYSNRIGNSNRQLAAVALAVSHAQAKLAATSLSRLSRATKLGKRDLGALNDCRATVGDGARQLGRCSVELGRKARPGEEFGWRMSNMETWASTALTDMETCIEGFVGRSPIKAEVRRRLASVTQVTSVALALVNRFAAARRG